MARHSPPPRPAPVGGSVLSNESTFSIVKWCQLPGNIAGNPRSSGGPVTSGSRFEMIAPASILGVRFYWASSGVARVVKASLWGPDTTRLASVNLSVPNVSGEYEVLFATPYTLGSPGSLGPALLYKPLAVTIYEASDYTLFNTNIGSSPGTGSATPTGHPLFPFVGGNGIVWLGFNAWTGSDAYPATNAGTERYPVEPIFTVS